MLQVAGFAIFDICLFRPKRNPGSDHPVTTDGWLAAFILHGLKPEATASVTATRLLMKVLQALSRIPHHFPLM